jgi:hypothetical protein
VFELFFAEEHGGSEAMFLRESKDGRDLHNAIRRPVIVPGNLVFLNAHAGQHGRMRRQREGWDDSVCLSGAGAIGFHLMKHGQVRLFDETGIALIKADDENMVCARGGVDNGLAEKVAREESN